MRKVTAAQIKKNYTSKTVTVVNGATDVNLLTLAADAFTKNAKVHAVLIRSDKNITVKFNSATNDAIPIDANAPFPFSALEITAIFFSNASPNATVNIILV